LKIKKLEIENFKGIKNFIFEPNGNNAEVWGKNETGKTTLQDSFLWLLFGKDSSDKKDFDIKPLDENHKPIPGLEVLVECEFMDGTTLKRTYYEKWVKHKGSAEKVFEGHSTDYFIDGVPTKAGDYADYINSIATEDVFKLLTNPLYFNEGLHWTKRRDLLLEVCGDVTDDDVIKSSDKLAELADIIGNLTIEKKKVVLIEQKTKINKQLDKLPIRIDEADKSKPDIADMDFETIGQEIKSLQGKVKGKRQQIESLKSGGGMAELRKQLSEIEAKIQSAKNEHNEEKDSALREVRNQISDVESDIVKFQREMASSKDEKKRLEDKINSYDNQLETLRKEWKSINGRTFEYSAEKVCPTCGQDLPEDQLEKARQKALESFNVKKSKELEENTSQGKTLSGQKKQTIEDLKKAENTILSTGKQIIALNEKLNKLNEKLESTRQKYLAIKKPGYQDMFTARENTIRKLAEDGKSESGEVKLLEIEIQSIEEEIEELQAQYAKKEQFERATNRIKELMAEQKKLSKEFNEISRQLQLMDEFTKTKVSMMDEKINAKFKYARFKMFKELVNGGIEDCCETLVPNTKTGALVSFSSANDGNKILAGCDIINTLSEHYGFYPPVFIDNFESITHEIDMKAQMIKLIVSKKDKVLRVEIDE